MNSSPASVQHYSTNDRAKNRFFISLCYSHWVISSQFCHNNPPACSAWLMISDARSPAV